MSKVGVIYERDGSEGERPEIAEDGRRPRDKGAGG